MEPVMDSEMKDALRKCFPAYVARMELATTDGEIIAIHEELLANCQRNIVQGSATLSQTGAENDKNDVRLSLHQNLETLWLQRVAIVFGKRY